MHCRRRWQRRWWRHRHVYACAGNPPPRRRYASRALRLRLGFNGTNKMIMITPFAMCTGTHTQGTRARTHLRILTKFRSRRWQWRVGATATEHRRRQIAAVDGCAQLSLSIRCVRKKRVNEELRAMRVHSLARSFFFIQRQRQPSPSSSPLPAMRGSCVRALAAYV